MWDFSSRFVDGFFPSRPSKSKTVYGELRTFAAVREMNPGFQIAGVVMGPRSTGQASSHSATVRQQSAWRVPEWKTSPDHTTASCGNSEPRKCRGSLSTNVWSIRCGEFSQISSGSHRQRSMIPWRNSLAVLLNSAMSSLVCLFRACDSRNWRFFSGSWVLSPTIPTIAKIRLLCSVSLG